MLVQNMLFKHNSVITIINASIKDNIAISISHIYTYSKELSKKIHHIVNVTSTEVELFTIRYTINQSCHVANVHKIIITTDAIHVARNIFDLSIHLYQLQVVKVTQCLRVFFNRDLSNIVEF